LASASLIGQKLFPEPISLCRVDKLVAERGASVPPPNDGSRLSFGGS
jgi:hypothetical protein